MFKPKFWPLFGILKSPNFKQKWKSRNLPKKTTLYYEPRGSDIAKAK